MRLRLEQNTYISLVQKFRCLRVVTFAPWSIILSRAQRAMKKALGKLMNRDLAKGFNSMLEDALERKRKKYLAAKVAGHWFNRLASMVWAIAARGSAGLCAPCAMRRAALNTLMRRAGAVKTANDRLASSASSALRQWEVLWHLRSCASCWLASCRL